VVQKFVTGVEAECGGAHLNHGVVFIGRWKACRGAADRVGGLGTQTRDTTTSHGRLFEEWCVKQSFGGAEVGSERKGMIAGER